MSSASERDGETLSDEQTFGGSGTLAQFVASERRSMERAVGVIGAYVAEERREMLVAKTSGDEAQARFNSINADCVEHFLAETAALRAECEQLRADARRVQLIEAYCFERNIPWRSLIDGLAAARAAASAPAPVYAHTCAMPDASGNEQECEACAHDAASAPQEQEERNG